MGVIDGLFDKRVAPGANINWSKYFRGAGGDTPAGVEVTHANSLQVSAVFACVRVIAETVGMLPLITYQRLERGKRRANEFGLYSLLHDLPNPEMTSIELRETATGHLASWGNAYLEIEYSGGGAVRGLWPLRPDRMKVARVDGTLRYVYSMPERSGAGTVELPANRVMHIRGLGFDGVMGYDPIMLAKNSIGLAMATTEFGSRFFSNGAQTGTVYQHPGQLSDTAFKRLAESIEQRHQGLENAHRIMILEEGMKAENVSVPPENAQFLETKNATVPEIARYYRMPLHKIQDLEKATFSNIEHQAIEFVTDTIMPWLTRWEQAIFRDLLTKSERRQYFAEHLIDALLRGDTKSRFESYAIGRQWGWYSANDIREKENENPVDGGDVYLVPLNMVPADQISEMSPTSAPVDPQTARAKLPVETRAMTLARGRLRMQQSYERIMRDAAERVVRREVADVKRAVGKHLLNRSAADFSIWLREFYADHAEFWRRQFLPLLLTLADQVGGVVADEIGGEPMMSDDLQKFIEAYVTSLGKREASSSELQLTALLDAALLAGEDPAPILDERLEQWSERRAVKVARHESRNAFNALAVAIYQARNVETLVWRAVGDSCPYCTDLDGTEIQINGYFLEAGVDYQPEGAERPLNRSINVRHGPIHTGCDCQTMAR